MPASTERPVEVRFPNFLGEQHQALLDFVLDRERDFQTATLSQGATRAVNEAVRRAKILGGWNAFEDDFTDRLKRQLPLVLEGLSHTEFPLGRIEAQITASNDGDYFRLHLDGGPDSTREISFVYFLHREPRRFSGGELRICQTRAVDGILTLADILVAPEGDTIVFFPSHVPHEVLPVLVPSRAFADSRFTVNGWIHRK